MQLEMFGHVNSVPDEHYFTVSFTYTTLCPHFLQINPLDMVLEAYIKEFTIGQKTSTLNYTRKEVGLEAEGEIFARVLM